MPRLLAVAALFGLLVAVPAVSQPPGGAPGKMKAPTKPSPPRLVPVADTKLLMEGLAQPNFQGMEKILKGDEIDAESWAFARGQAILLAETSNLLMLRPPRNSGQDAWMKSAAELRDGATGLAQTLASRDRARSRAALTNLAATCNACHQTFQVKTKITAFAP
jgi:cytochrome c556